VFTIADFWLVQDNVAGIKFAYLMKFLILAGSKVI